MVLCLNMLLVWWSIFCITFSFNNTSSNFYISVKFQCDFNLIKKINYVTKKLLLYLLFRKHIYRTIVMLLLFNSGKLVAKECLYSWGFCLCLGEGEDFGGTSYQLHRICLIFFSFIFHLLGFHFSRHPSRHFIFTVQPNN